MFSNVSENSPVLVEAEIVLLKPETTPTDTVLLNCPKAFPMAMAVCPICKEDESPKTTGENFLDLLKKLNEVEGIERFRISSIEPNLLHEKIIYFILYYFLYYLLNIMTIESKIPRELKVGSKDQIIETILACVPGYNKINLDEPIGQDQTTLDQFLNNKNEGSEWTDPYGFKINIVGGEYKFSF